MGIQTDGCVVVMTEQEMAGWNMFKSMFNGQVYIPYNYLVSQ